MCGARGGQAQSTAWLCDRAGGRKPAGAAGRKRGQAQPAGEAAGSEDAGSEEAAEAVELEPVSGSAHRAERLGGCAVRSQGTAQQPQDAGLRGAWLLLARAPLTHAWQRA
jgi:hypothetical protein